MKTIAIIKKVFVLNIQVKVFESVNESSPNLYNLCGDKVTPYHTTVHNMFRDSVTSAVYIVVCGPPPRPHEAHMT